MKRWLFSFVALALVAGGWFYFSKRSGEQVQFQTVTVTSGDLTQAVTATGQLNAVVNVQVGSQISGIIQKLFADFNSPVKAGQVIANLDPATYQAVVHQAEGDLANAKAALELARVTARRKQELLTQHAAAPADVDIAVAALHQAEATVAVRQANLERARVDFERCTIVAPIDGIVISRSVDVGQTVAASLSAPVLFTIANDLRNMQIDANVAEADIGNIEVDQAVEFTVDAFPYRTFQGKVTQVRNAPTTVQNVVTYDAVIAVSNQDMKLKPGMTANVSVIIAKRENVLKVPNAALRFRPPQVGKPDAATPGSRTLSGTHPHKSDNAGVGAQRTIYTPSSDRRDPKAIQVQLGISDGISTEMLSGLKENDLVITGVISSQSTAQGTQPQNPNPLGGGMRRF
jgi:HlyD family secretion protein